MTNRRRWPPTRAWASLLLVLALAGCVEGDSANSSSSAEDPPLAARSSPAAPASARGAGQGPTFVGSARCASCHPRETERWAGSDHDRSMEAPSARSVLGRFDGGSFRSFEQSWRLDRLEGGFEVSLEEPGRETRRWPIAYTFGVEPLQQYLVRFPDGRLQALPIAWDARPDVQGGQRWFSLQADEPVPAGDPLHWEGLAYNWNSQCAACHSTQVQKGYDPASGRFETEFAEIDVGCEACHGPASLHVAAMAEPSIGPIEGGGLRVAFEAWDLARWDRADTERVAARRSLPAPEVEIDVCGPCHARRGALVDSPEVGVPFLDAFRPAIPRAPLYFDDGQIREEVYVYGSFLQSRMYGAGVRCSDCHDPHSLALRRDGNALCLGCHAPVAYETQAHHGHPPGTPGGRCVDCHMPARTYMEIDPRRDHAFVVPRPRRDEALGAPSVCKDCHAERDVDWATAAIARWRGERPPHVHWADRWVVDGDVGANEPGDAALGIALDSLQTPLVRAAAWLRVSERAARAPPLDVLADRIQHGSDLERLALVEVARRLPGPIRIGLLGPLLESERRAVRIAAAEALSDLPPQDLRPADRSRLARALREFRSTQRANAERPEAQVSLGVMALRSGDIDAARAAYERALLAAPYFVPAHANLADLERALGNDDEAARRLKVAVELAPDDAMVRHALGLALHRVGRADDALEELERAARRSPTEPRLLLGWALALDAAGRRGAAIARLSEGIERARPDADLHHALATLLRDAGETTAAADAVRAWAARFPADERAARMREELEARLPQALETQP